MVTIKKVGVFSRIKTPKWPLWPEIGLKIVPGVSSLGPKMISNFFFPKFMVLTASNFDKGKGQKSRSWTQRAITHCAVKWKLTVLPTWIRALNNPESILFVIKNVPGIFFFPKLGCKGPRIWINGKKKIAPEPCGALLKVLWNEEYWTKRPEIGPEIIPRLYSLGSKMFPGIFSQYYDARGL